MSTALMAASGLLAIQTRAFAQAPSELPRIESRNGRHALVVDGAPFFMLGAQVNNSSNYAEPLATVWPVLDRIGANTVEVPVAWQQVEPQEGQFDFSFLQTLLDQARAQQQACRASVVRHVEEHLVLLHPRLGQARQPPLSQDEDQGGRRPWRAQRPRDGDTRGRQARLRPADDLSRATMIRRTP
ncbi:beta-galactosidase [Caulobacter segnis]